MRCSEQPRWRRQRGQSLLETAMMMIVIFTLVFWVIELGYFTYTYAILADAANEGVRHSIVTSGGDVAGTQTVVKNFVATSPQNVSSSISTSVTFPDGSAAPPNRVRVAVTYTYIPALPQFITAPTMHSFAEGRMVAQ